MENLLTNNSCFDSSDWVEPTLPSSGLYIDDGKKPDQVCITIHSEQTEKEWPSLMQSPDLRMEGPPIWPVLNHWGVIPFSVVALLSAFIVRLYHDRKHNFL